MTDRDRHRLAAYENFPAWIADLRTRHGVREIAIAAGIDHSSVSRLVRHQRAPTLETARALIEAFIP